MVEISNSELLTRILSHIKSESERIREELKDEIQKMNGKLIEKIDTCFKNVNELENKLKTLEYRCVNFERYTRKNNILIFGLNIPERVDQIEWVLNRIKELIGVDVTANEINNIFPIKVGNKKPIKIEFISCWKKNVILRNSYKLKGKNINFVQDLCFEDRQDQRILRKHLNDARSKNYSAKIKGRNLIVNNEVYTVAQLKKLETKEDNIEINTIFPPTQETKPSSAQQTPTQNIHKIRKRNEDAQVERKEELSKGEGKQKKEENEIEKTTPEQKTEIQKKTEDNRKKTDIPNIPRERSQSTAGLNTRVTRQQNLR